MISYIIPHKDRKGLLGIHLDSLKKSSFSDFEVIIVNDGSGYALSKDDFDFDNLTVINLEQSHGPAFARNSGAREAKGDILLFVGDDCIPTEDTIIHHYLAHRAGGVDIVQGYTGFHPNQLGTHFMTFLNKSGLQANWNGLKNENGSWKKEVEGFFLTTNVSVKKDKFFDLGGFDTTFPRAAWEDVEFGTRAQRNNYKTVLEPLSVNFHQHGYTYWEFCQRQFMEGTQRINLALAHPEMSPYLINPQQIRDVKAQAHELEIVNNGLMLVNLNIEKFVQLQWELWNEGLQMMSVLGIINELENREGIYNIFFHLHTQEEVMVAASGISAMDRSDAGYAQHCKSWLVELNPTNWAVYMYAAEVDYACGDIDLCKYNLNKARELAPTEVWVRGFVIK